MDADHRLTDDELDGRLRALFQTAGPLEAPTDLEAQVLTRLNSAPVLTSLASKPLVSRNAWAATVAAFIALWIWTALSSAPEMPALSPAAFARPSLDMVLSVMTGSWAMMAVASGALFLLLETVLSRPRLIARAA